MITTRSVYYLGSSTKPSAAAVPRPLGAAAAGGQRHAQCRADGQPKCTNMGTIHYLDDIW